MCLTFHRWTDNLKVSRGNNVKIIGGFKMLDVSQRKPISAVLLLLLCTIFSTCLLATASANGQGPFSTVIEAVNAPGLYTRAFLDSEYNEHSTKYLFKAGGSITMKAVADIGADVFIDLDDYFAITKEGQAGWVTMWLVGNFGVSIGFPPVYLGIVRLPGQPYDPDFYFEINMLSGTILTELTNIELVSGQTTNIDHLEFESISTEINFTLAEAVFPLAKIEVRKEYLDMCLINAVVPGNPISVQFFVQKFIDQLLPLMSGQSPPDIYRFATRTDLDFSSPGPPELLLTDLYFYCADECSSVIILQGKQINFQATVQNIGKGDVSFNLSFYLDQTSEENLINRFSDLFLPGDYDPDDGWISFLKETIFYDTTAMAPGNHTIIARIESSSPTESNLDNNTAYVGIVIVPTLPVSSIVSVSPNPAMQGKDTVTFTASAHDQDNQGAPPEIRNYRWTTNIGKTNGQSDLYSGINPSFSLSASDLKAGTHNISLTVQDNEGDWSEAVTAELTIIPHMPEQGHDLAINYFNVTPPNRIPTDGSVGVTVTVKNEGQNTESSYSVIYRLRKEIGEILDEKTLPGPTIQPGELKGMPDVTLRSKGGYQGSGYVEVTIVIPLDEDRSDNHRSISFYIGEPQRYDGYTGGSWTLVRGDASNLPEEGNYRITYCATQPPNLYVDIIRISDGQPVEVHQTPIPLDSMAFFDGDHVAVAYYGTDHSGGITRTGLGLFIDNVPELHLSEKHVTVPEGRTATFTVQRSTYLYANSLGLATGGDGATVGGWNQQKREVDLWTVEFSLTPPCTSRGYYEFWLSYLWQFSVTAQANERTCNSCALRARLTVLPDEPPETYIITGPEGVVTDNDVTFTWSGADDLTQTSQLLYSYRLEPLETMFGPFSSQTSKTYTDLKDGSYTFWVKARDAACNNEDPTPVSRSFTVAANRTPDIPVNEYPIPHQLGISPTPVLIASEFLDPDTGDTFAGSRFQVRSDTGTYDNQIWDSGDSAPGTTTVHPTQRFALCSKYWWRCRYRDNKGAWSAWSNETCFTTKCSANFDDFAVFANRWNNTCSEPDWCDGFDRDKSGMIDFKDLAILVLNWLEQRACTYEVTNLTRLTDWSVGQQECTFNQTGTLIAYRNLYPPHAWTNSDIWAMSPDGSGNKQITSGPSGEFGPRFVPDGRITYVKEFGSNDYNIWMVNADGSNPHQLIGGPLRQGGAGHDWHPSGQKFAYTNEYIQDADEVWLANADGTFICRLTDHTVDGYSQECPIYSRSGNQIAYVNVALKGSLPHVWVMNADGSGKQQVTFGSVGQTPMFWCPGDSHIGYNQNGEIWLHNLATGTEDLLLAVSSASIGRADLAQECTKLVFDLSDASGTHIWICEVICNSSP
jgi:hypothetical protein